MMQRLLALWLLLSVALAADSRPAIQPDGLLAHVKFLSSDELEGRGNGTKGLERAADYIAEQFKAAGLQPGGTNGTWFQPFELVTGLTVGEPNRLTLRAGDRRAAHPGASARRSRKSSNGQSSAG